MESSAQRRMRAIQAHLAPTIDDETCADFHRNLTAGEFCQEILISHQASHTVVVCQPRPLIMWNPRLISEDVGVGVNVRQLKRFFLRTFSVVYSMKPMASGAVFRCYPGLWKVFYDDKDRPGRYVLAKEVISRPDAEDLELIFGDVQEKLDERPSLFARAAAIFSSVNRFMKVISK